MRSQGTELKNTKTFFTAFQLSYRKADECKLYQLPKGN